MLSDLQIAQILQDQYNATPNTFDFADRIDDVSFGIKRLPDCTVIAFEGTYCLPDWMSNFDTVMIHPPGIGGVSRGFYDGLPETLAALSPMLDRPPIYCIGHSRGSAHAQIFAAMLINAGYKVEVVTFGAPRTGDAALAAILSKSLCRWYRNYHDEEHQDLICEVPIDIPELAPYVHPGTEIRIDIAPQPNDNWGVFARHHLFLYQQWLEEHQP